MKTAKRLLALALAGVMALALLTGCSDSSSKAKQVEECFRSLMKQQGGDYQKDETLDKKLEGIAQQFQPDWLASGGGGGDRLTREANDIIKNELGDYLETGCVWLWYGEVKPGQSALTQAESMKRCDMVEFTILESGTKLEAVAFTMTDKKSDGHRYYLALETNATIKTPQT